MSNGRMALLITGLTLFTITEQALAQQISVDPEGAIDPVISLTTTDQQSYQSRVARIYRFDCECSFDPPSPYIYQPISKRTFATIRPTPSSKFGKENLTSWGRQACWNSFTTFSRPAEYPTEVFNKYTKCVVVKGPY
jgi:hypothetical protein